MKVLVICALSLAACVVSADWASAASPRVLVEVAYVVRSQEKPKEKSLEEEITAALKQSKEVASGLDPFLKAWLADKDRSRFTIDCIRVTAPLGADIEVQTARSEGDDPSGEVANPGVPIPRLLGLSFDMKTAETEDGKINLECRLSKASPAEELSVSGIGGKPMYGIRTFMLNPRLTLEPNVPQVVGQVTSETRRKDKTLKNEVLLIFRVVPIPEQASGLN